MSARNAEASQRKANPDDPHVQQPPRGSCGPVPGPNYLGFEGRIAILQTQVFLLALIMIAQLWLITNALNELLSGRTTILGWLVLASGLGFALALLITIRPRRRLEEPYKISDIRVARELTDLGLKEAKTEVDKSPKALKFARCG